MADLTKLITLGKLEETYQIGSVSFTLTTPPFLTIDANTTTKPYDILRHTLIKIDGEDITNVEGQEKLKTALDQMQGAVISKLLELGTALSKRQVDLVQDIVAKKE